MPLEMIRRLKVIVAINIMWSVSLILIKQQKKKRNSFSIIRINYI